MVLNIQRGKTIQCVVSITNAGAAGTFYIRCSIVPTGQTMGFDIPSILTGTPLDYTIVLAAGGPGIATFRGTIPTTATLGLYNSVAIAREFTGGTSPSLGDRTETDQVNVIAAYQVTITNIEETQYGS